MFFTPVKTHSVSFNKSRDLLHEEFGLWRLCSAFAALSNKLAAKTQLLIRYLKISRTEKAFMGKQKQVELGRVTFFPEETGKGLLIAREEERRKIAHELHDAFGQELVTILLELHQIIKDFKNFTPENDLSRQMCLRLDSIFVRVSQLASSINEVSHQLHPTVLERSGLRFAIERLCADLSAAGKTQIYFVGTQLKKKLSPAISLCLYRIAQEALHNVDRHAHALRAEVILKEHARSIVLTVRDHGVGYDQKQLDSNTGLGLASMEERAISMGGAFALKTALGKGTEVTVQLPLKNNN